MLGKILSSHSRSVMVWNYDKNLIVYTIPLMSGLESSLGSTLELVLDLRKSYEYQQSYRRIAGIPARTELLNVPLMQTPLDLSLSCKKVPHKTLLFCSEVSSHQLSDAKKEMVLQ